jgi:nicotinate-nucleotide adenylyltransferase
MKIGVFGGTFDPVHWGHLVLADEARTRAGLDIILFVPSGLPPHKAARRLTPIGDRLAMVRLAVRGIPGFDVSAVESERNGPHYTVETLREISRQHPLDEISFVLGSDSLLELGTWLRPEEIVALTPLVVLARPGFDPASADPLFTRRVTIVDGVTVSVSSTLVRRRIATGSSVRFLVPEAVLDYARRERLYLPGETA